MSIKKQIRICIDGSFDHRNLEGLDRPAADQEPDRCYSCKKKFRKTRLDLCPTCKQELPLSERPAIEKKWALLVLEPMSGNYPYRNAYVFCSNKCYQVKQLIE